MRSAFAPLLCQVPRHIRTLSAMSVSAVVLSACGGGSSSSAPTSSGTSSPPPAVTAAQISGFVTAGPAQCEISIIDAAGKTLGVSVSDASGAFSFEFSNTTEAVAQLQATNCAYSDELTGQTRTGATLSTLVTIPDNLNGAVLEAQITPFTTIVDKRLTRDTPIASLTKTDVSDMTSTISRQMFGGSGNIATTRPIVSVDADSATAPDASRDYGLWLAAVSGMGSLEDAVEQLSTLELTETTAIDALFEGAVAFERSGRNRSGAITTTVLAPALSNGVRSGSAPRALPGDRAVTGRVGEAFTLDAQTLFEDSDTDRLRFIVTGLPEGLTIDDQGVITGTPTEVMTDELLLSAYDDTGNGAALKLALTISAAATGTDDREETDTDTDTDTEGDGTEDDANSDDDTNTEDGGDTGDGDTGDGNTGNNGGNSDTDGDDNTEDSDTDTEGDEGNTDDPGSENQPPTAVINGGAREGVAPFRTFLNADRSTDEDGTIVSYLWDLGNGDQREGPTFNYTYEEAGNFTITLTVTDNDGAKTSQTRQANISAPVVVKPILLPVEVLGAERATVERIVTLTDATGVTRMSMTCHRCDYRDSGTNTTRPDKASIRINDEPWIDINDDIATVAYPEINYGGIRGAYHTVRFTIPVSGLVDGENVVRFRFNGTDGFTNGYRILNFNFIGANGAQIPDRDFIDDDPTLWTPELTSANDLSLGEQLWTGKQALKESPLSTNTIRASCADCHASGGEDLKYFNYSDTAIEARSKFHGLDGIQARRVASYIRSLSTPAPQQARPWNPPYQPGPGLDSKPAQEWAAGAGLDAVLDRDEDMLPFLFPNGTSKGAVEKIVSSRNTLNTREQPIALQLPDWKMWLPEIHPKDIWGDDWQRDFLPFQKYTEMQTAFENGGAETLRTRPDDVRDQTLIKLVDSFGAVSAGFVGQNGPQPCLNSGVYRSIGLAALGRSDTIPSRVSLNNDPDLCETLLRSMAHWLAVKGWETHQRYGLEDAAPDLYPYGEVRSWLGSRRAVFDLAPHRAGNDSATFRHLTRGESSYHSTAWYQLQVILNAGNRNPQNHRPPDWKYQMNWMAAASEDNDHPVSLRYIQTAIKMQQNLDMRPPIDQPGGVSVVPDYYPFLEDRGPEQNGWWVTTHASPHRAFSVDGSFWKTQQYRFDILNNLDNIQPGLKLKFQNAYIEQWLDKTETYDIADFPRAETQNGLTPADSIPTPQSGFLIADSTRDDNRIYRLVPYMRDSGVDPVLTDRIIDWGETAWPLGDWDSLRR